MMMDESFDDFRELLELYDWMVRAVKVIVSSSIIASLLILWLRES